MSYLPGLLTLDYSLKRVKSAYPLLALHTDALPQEGLDACKARGIATRHIKKLLPAANDIDYGNDPRFQDTWSKLAVFELTEYDRVVLLDSDMLVRKNLDELMDIELDPPSMQAEGDRVFAAAHACCCNPMKKPHYPKTWVPSACAFTAQHADPALAQKSGTSNKLSFGMPNSGTVVTNPCHEAYERILAQLKNDEAVRSYIFPDQALLGDVFHGRWVSLPYVYNGLKTMRQEEVHGAIWRDDCVKNVHYIFGPKPWQQRREDCPDEIYTWWHDANDERLAEEKKAGIHDRIGDTTQLP